MNNFWKWVCFFLAVAQVMINMSACYTLGVQAEKIGQLEDMVFNGGYKHG